MDILTYRLHQLAGKVHQLIAGIKQLPAGGSAGQVLAKVSSQDFAVGWVDPPSSGGGTWEPPIATGSITQYWRGDKSWQTLDKTAVGLANADNTSDANKPVSTAQQTALNLKASLAGANFTGPISATNLSGTNSGDQDLSGLQPIDADLTAIAALTGTGFLKRTGSNAWALDTSSYLTANQAITLSGDASGSGSTAISVTLATVNSNTGTFGGATTSPQISVDGKGRITGVSAITITPAWASITSKPTTLAGFGITDAQGLNNNLTAYAGANWSAGVQVPTLTAANTVTLKTVGQATGNLLDKAAGDALYRPITYTPAYTEIGSVPTGTILYRRTAGTGAAEAQTLATLKTDLGLATVATSGSASDLTTGTLPSAQLPGPSIQAVTSSATVTPTFSNDMVKVTAQAAGLTLANPTGTAVPGKKLVIRIKDNGTPQTIAFGTQYRVIGTTLPTTTVSGKTLYLGLIFNSDDTKWDLVAVNQEA